MTTAQFINKAFTQRKQGKCSSVFSDFDGNVFSYGYHYPLLFRVNGHAVRNVRGYSSTTDRHIAWSRSIPAIEIHFHRDFRLGNDAWNIQAGKSGQLAYIDSLKRQMDAKKRKDTKVYAFLESQHARAVKNLKALEAIA